MDPTSRWLTTFLVICNTIIIVFVANMVVNMKTEIGALKADLATRADLATMQTRGAQPSFHQETCTRCHTERRFAGQHTTGDELMRIVRRMQSQPDARISSAETEKIHASLMLLKCTQCHSGDTLQKLSLMNSEQRLSLIEKMAKKPQSAIPIGEARDILDSFELLLGF